MSNKHITHTTRRRYKTLVFVSFAIQVLSLMPRTAHPTLRAAVDELALPEDVLTTGIRECGLKNKQLHKVSVSYGLKGVHSVGLAFEVVSVHSLTILYCLL